MHHASCIFLLPLPFLTPFRSGKFLPLCAMRLIEEPYVRSIMKWQHMSSSRYNTCAKIDTRSKWLVLPSLHSLMGNGSHPPLIYQQGMWVFKCTSCLCLITWGAKGCSQLLCHHIFLIPKAIPWAPQAQISESHPTDFSLVGCLE